MNIYHGERELLSANQLKPCPFCNHQIVDVEDSVHPSGTYWKYDPVLDCKMYGFDNKTRHYTVDKTDNPCYIISCLEHEGGCGASIQGDTLPETINKWNRRP